MNVSNINTIACIGAGVIGHSWATLFAQKGYHVNLYDVTKKRLSIAQRQIRGNYGVLIENGIMTKNEADTAFNRIRITNNLEAAVKSVDYVQESCPEDYHLKKELFTQIESLVDTDVLLASSTSALLMTKIQSTVNNPERCIIAHPLNPPHLIPLVEIVCGEQTSEEVTDLTRQFMLKLGKIPIVLKKEIPGYVANRLQNALLREAISLVGQKVVTAPELDIAVSSGLGLRWALMGPFTIHHLASPGGIADKLLHQKFSPVEEGKDMRVVDTKSPIYSSLRPAAESTVKEIETWFSDKDVNQIKKLRDSRLIKLLSFLKLI